MKSSPFYVDIYSAAWACSLTPLSASGQSIIGHLLFRQGRIERIVKQFAQVLFLGMVFSRYCALPPRNSFFLSRREAAQSMPEERQQDNDRNRNAKQPEKNSSTHDGLL
jgi:hypothetical protein